MVILIACLNNLGYLSKNGKLMYSFKKDLEFFKEKTLGQKVVMGRKTYESMDYKPLKQRENIIISSNKNFKLEEEEKYSNVRVLTIEEIEKEIKENTELVYFIIGGAQLYENFIDSADKLYLTHVKDMSKGDEKVRFHRFNANNYKINNIFTGIELDRNNNSNCIIDIKEYIKTKNF